MIETRLLRYFLAIAREQNITRAAETLHLTQSTLSKQMMDLENQLGKQLLIRGKRKVTLTEEGQFLRKQAQEIMELMDKTESAFSAGQELVGGDIYLAAPKRRPWRRSPGFSVRSTPTIPLFSSIFSRRGRNRL